MTSRDALRAVPGRRRRRTVSPAVRLVVVTLAVLAAGCAMRVGGVVRDRATGAPIGGAILQASDGRGRLAVTDASGGYELKTDRRPTTLSVTAPGYRSTTVAVPGDAPHPVVDVELDRAERLAPDR